MASKVSPPDTQALLHPLLACLPTAFVSPRPPPALLPLLSPILRQRVHHLSATSGPSDTWLSLLSWDRENSAKLPAIVENMHLEPHPVSGEIELEDVGEARYRRVDEETLQARIEAPELGLGFVYVWCASDEGGGSPGWRLAELRALEGSGDESTRWFATIYEAEENSDAVARRKAPAINGRNASYASTGSNDDDYWNAYDRSPGRTPQKSSPAPPSLSSVQQPSQQELEYFARYMSEVQPAMDPHDPDEEGINPQESTLHGNTISNTQGGARRAFEPTETDESRLGTNGYDSSMPAVAASIEAAQPSVANATRAQIETPRPTSSASLDGFARLERKASIASQAEVAIKQHISTDMKSLFRLSQAAGIERAEFERIIKTELECLSLMDLDE